MRRHALVLQATGAEAAALYARLVRLRRRLRALDAARAVGALAGAAICAAAFALCVGALQNAAVAAVLFLFFGSSAQCTIASLTRFFAETAMSSRRTLPPLTEDA